jgi:hypothetical protein
MQASRTAINRRISATLLARTRKGQIEHENALRLSSLLARFMRDMERQKDRGRAAVVNLVYGLGNPDPTTKEMTSRFDDYIRGLIREELEKQE